MKFYFEDEPGGKGHWFVFLSIVVIVVGIIIVSLIGTLA